MLTSKDFQANEKKSMKKVQIQEDSSDGEDVDFGDVKSKSPSTPASTSNGTINSTSATSNGPKSTPTAQSATTQPIIEKMTEDEQDLTYLKDMTTSTKNGVDPEQKLKEQEARVKSFISQ